MSIFLDDGCNLTGNLKYLPEHGKLINRLFQLPTALTVFGHVEALKTLQTVMFLAAKTRSTAWILNETLSMMKERRFRKRRVKLIATLRVVNVFLSGSGSRGRRRISRWAWWLVRRWLQPCRAQRRRTFVLQARKLRNYNRYREMHNCSLR